MAGLAYLLPPLTGLLAYFAGTDERARFHGLQSVALGLVWPAAMYAGSWVTPGLAQAGWTVGAVAWLVLLGGAASGRDPRLPWAGSRLRRLAASPPR
ncbi:MAG TPA: hypothetical protein VHK89_00645 [Actinomycetota bacterium]|nr:hypothetical protein [Actinomycetota bacterium]